MKQEELENQHLECEKCKVVLKKGKVNITYLKSTFPVELLKCPKCGQVFISEELALGKIAEVEKTLEDK
ncbi:MAG: DVU_1557 family redox protein [Dehalobacterium sp.]